MPDYRKEAKHLIGLGISVTPLDSDGGKKSKIKWEHLRRRFLTDWEIDLYCKDCGGLAAITGGFSKLVCIDFDLDKQLPHQDYWKAFCEGIPEPLRKKFRVNETRSGGKHIWLRTEGFLDGSRKITHRLKTIPELFKEFEEKKEGTDETKLNSTLLNKPTKCVIETRFEGSYGVIVHPNYKHFYGIKLFSINYDEWRTIEEKLYSLDCGFVPRPKYVGEASSYALIGKYNSETNSDMVADMMVGTGNYTINGYDREGNVLLKRDGSNNSHSSKVFIDTGNIIDFGESNVFTDEKKSHTPFEVFCAVNCLTEDEAIEKLKEIYEK